MTRPIHSISELEARVGARPATADLKVIDHLDACARRWLAASPFAFASFSDERDIGITLAGGAPGFAQTAEAGRLRLPLHALDDPGLPRPGNGTGLLFLIPGVGETLRVNGVVQAVNTQDVIIEVRECYGHCAKALLRADFWQADPVPRVETEDDFLAQARLMGLATSDAQGQTDLSPKGDPAGQLVKRIGSDIFFADRPGNRRTDSFRNLLTRPLAAAVLIAPGATRVATLKGEALLSANPALCAPFAVRDKSPRLVTRFTEPKLAWHDSPALQRARLWESPQAPAHIDPPALFAAHVRLNKTRSVTATLVKAAVSVPGLMRKGLEQDYKNNLY